MYTAFSRQPRRQKEYVQDLIKQQSGLLKQLVREEDAHVYICGDAKRMAKDVWQCFVDILGDCGPEYVAEMRKAGGGKRIFGEYSVLGSCQNVIVSGFVVSCAFARDNHIFSCKFDLALSAFWRPAAIFDCQSNPRPRLPRRRRIFIYGGP